MAKGRVKWFNDAKGFGFIEGQGISGDVFVHFSAIAMNGYKTLKEGAMVEFEVVTQAKGNQALDVRESEGVQACGASDGAFLFKRQSMAESTALR